MRDIEISINLVSRVAHTVEFDGLDVVEWTGGVVDYAVVDPAVVDPLVVDFGTPAGSGSTVTSVNKSDRDIIGVTVSIPTASVSDTDVTVYFDGVKSQYEDYGIGKNIHLVCPGGTFTNTDYEQTKAVVTIPAGSTSKTIAMIIVNNSVLELDRVVTVSSPGFALPKQLTIVDDSGGTVINAVTDYLLWAGAGLVPTNESSAADNKTNLQACFDYIDSTFDPVTQPVIVYIPDGTYYLEHGIEIQPGTVVVGQSRTGTILKRPSYSWYGTAGYDLTDFEPVTFEAGDVSAGDNTITLSTDIGDDTMVYFDGSDLPSPLSSSTLYYTLRQSATVFKFSTSSGGAEVNITDAGTGGEISQRGKYFNMFYNEVVTTPWNNTSNATLGGFRNITLDGNYSDFSSHRVWGYTYEYSHLINFRTKTALATPGKSRPLLENVEIGNNITSNFSLGDNTDCVIYHVTNTSSGESYKGDFSFTGGNTSGTIRDISTYRAVDFEQNSATSGHYSDSRLNIDFYDCDFSAVTLGCHASASGDQTIDFTDCTCGNFSVTATQATVTMTNCEFDLTTYGSTSNTLLDTVDAFLADSCTFNLNPQAGAQGGIRWLNITDTHEWKFLDCTFNSEDGDYETYLRACFYNGGSLTKTQGTLVLENCTFNNFDYVIYNGTGGEIEVITPTLVGCAAFARLYRTASYPYKLTVTGPFTADASLVKYLWLPQTSVRVAENEITHAESGGDPTVELTKAQALIYGGSATNAGLGVRGITYSGSRKITHTAADPNTDTGITGLPGDIYDGGGSIYEVALIVPVSEDFETTQVDVANNKFTSATNVWAEDTPVYFDTTGTAPSPISLNSSYFIKAIDATSFQISSTAAGAAIDITTTGSGTHTMSADQYNMGWYKLYGTAYQATTWTIVV